MHYDEIQVNVCNINIMEKGSNFSSNYLSKYYLAKEMQYIIFYAHVHACSPSYTDEECIFGLLIIF